MHTDAEMHANAVQRERQALERERVARVRRDEAEQEALATADPVLRRLHEREADVYGQAAEVHHHAAQIHAEHAEAHQGYPGADDPNTAKT